jgi:ABC-type polysaccharide/polyol phosphate export permease
MIAILYRELLMLRRRAGRALVSIGLTPLLYSFAFGWGLGEGLSVEGTPYLRFMLPGLMALSIMGQSFGIGTEINIDRFYNHAFEEALLAPAKPVAIASGYVLFGMVKGALAYLFCIGLMAAFDPGFSWEPSSMLPAALNSFQFSALGLLVALSVKTHRDMNAVTNYIIVPMSFLSGTVFSLERLPASLRSAIKLLPLSPATNAIRDACLVRPADPASYAIIAGYGILFFSLAAMRVRHSVE